MNLVDQEIEVVIFIVNMGQGRRIIKHGRRLGFTGATVFLGKGTVHYRSAWQRIFDLSDIRKEVVLMLSETRHIDEAMPLLDEKFRFDKVNHGIVFRIPVAQILGSMQYANQINKSKELNAMFHAIFVIVEKGLAEDVIEAATTAGSKGGTIINARGAGVHETSKVFNMEIEPEKEVVLILSEASKTERITESIRTACEIDKPGKGLIFVQDVKKTYGIYQDEEK